MSERYEPIVGRLGIVLLPTGLVVLLVGNLRAEANSNRINITWVNYIGIGLAIIGAILVIIFVATFLKKRKTH